MAMNDIGITDLREQGWRHGIVTLSANVPRPPYNAHAKVAISFPAFTLAKSEHPGRHLISHVARQFERITFSPTDNAVIRGKQCWDNVQD